MSLSFPSPRVLTNGQILYEHENQGADMTCSLDWGSHIFYDRWVLRTMTGR